MGTQIERFIDITKDNLSHLIQLWDNVLEKEIKGNGAIQVPLGVDFKQRNKTRNAENSNPYTGGFSNVSSPAKSQKVDAPVKVITEVTETVKQEAEEPKKVTPQAPKNLFNDETSSEEEDDLVS